MIIMWGYDVTKLRYDVINEEMTALATGRGWQLVDVTWAVIGGLDYQLIYLTVSVIWAYVTHAD